MSNPNLPSGLTREQLIYCGELPDPEYCEGCDEGEPHDHSEDRAEAQADYEYYVDGLRDEDREAERLPPARGL